MVSSLNYSIVQLLCRVILVHMWCTRRRHFCLLLSPFFSFFDCRKKAPPTSRMNGGLCLKYCRKEFLQRQQMPLLFEMSIHVLIVFNSFIIGRLVIFNIFYQDLCCKLPQASSMSFFCNFMIFLVPDSFLRLICDPSLIQVANVINKKSEFFLFPFNNVSSNFILFKYPGASLCAGCQGYRMECHGFCSQKVNQMSIIGELLIVELQLKKEFFYFWPKGILHDLQIILHKQRLMFLHMATLVSIYLASVHLFNVTMYQELCCPVYTLYDEFFNPSQNNAKHIVSSQLIFAK